MGSAYAWKATRAGGLLGQWTDQFADALWDRLDDAENAVRHGLFSIRVPEATSSHGAA